MPNTVPPTQQTKQQEAGTDQNRMEEAAGAAGERLPMTRTGVEEFQHIFISLAVFTALDIGMRQLVYKNNLWLTSQDCIDIHLREGRPAVLELPARHCVQHCGKFGNGLTTMCLNNTDDNIFATTMASDSLA